MPNLVKKFRSSAELSLLEHDCNGKKRLNLMICKKPDWGVTCRST